VCRAQDWASTGYQHSNAPRREADHGSCVDVAADFESYPIADGWRPGGRQWYRSIGVAPARHRWAHTAVVH
jgi:hypothetical protein